MRGVAALSWELLYRDRWLLSLTTLALVAMCGVCQLLPEDLRSPALGALALALVGPLIAVVGLLSHGTQGRLEATASSFPPRLFTLPVRTTALVGPPLILGTAVLVFFWLACAALLLRPCAIDAPLLWPGLFLAAVLAMLQALVWSPMPLPWMRLVVVVVAAPCLIGAVTTIVDREIGEMVLAPLSAALLLGGYVGSWRGVCSARRGVGVVEPVTVGPVSVSAAAWHARPFASPLRAQLWLERRVVGWMFFFIAGLCLTSTLPSMWLFDVVMQQNLPYVVPWLAQVQEVVGPSWVAMSLFLWVPLLASLAGADLGRMTEFQGKYAMPAFLATRPISTSAMMRAKLLTTAVGMGALWMLMALAGFGWALCMGRIGEMAERLVALTGSGLAAVGALAGGLALLAAVTWLWLLSNLWASALGRQALAVAPAGLAVVVVLVVTMLIKDWSDALSRLLGPAVALALAGKSAAVIWAALRLRREHLASGATLACTFAGWALLTAMVAGLALWFTGGGALIAGCVVLLMPLGRCLLAPLALARNRTR